MQQKEKCDQLEKKIAELQQQLDSYQHNSSQMQVELDCAVSDRYGDFCIIRTLYYTLQSVCSRDLRSFEIRFDFESNFLFGIRFVVMIRFEIFESSAPSIVLCKETIGGG